MKLSCNKTNPLLGGVLAAEYVKSLKNLALEIYWGDENLIDNCTKKIKCETNNDLLRAVARLLAENELYGNTPIEKTEVDHWLTYSLSLKSEKSDFNSLLTFLDKSLDAVTYLACKRLTIADFAIFASLYSSKSWLDILTSRENSELTQETTAKKKIFVNILRWYNFIKSNPIIAKTLDSLPNEVKSALTPVSGRSSMEKSNVGNRAREGKFVELPGAEMGKVVVRFPPEASGYLHIGHAKAALLNQYYQEAFQGKLIMRFDDTNPAKENVHFEKVILEDVAMLEIKPDMFTHTSQYFDLMLEYCEKLLKEGKAYVDDTDPETMKAQREQKIESSNRNNTYEQNAKLWEEMKKGTAQGQKYCVRAKIDMQSPNGCLRDPTIYRCKNEPHPRTGDKYKVYPTYDFACPIVDAIEGVTHTLRTMEYHDRDPQFYWFIDALGLRKPHIWEYSRLSMTNTVLSKRKLTWFVNEGLVDGWDDARMPTVRGVLRRGMTVQGLKEFIIAQGSSRSVVFMEWDKIWAFNKKVIDPIAPRFTALDFDSPVTVNVKGVKEECLTVPKHPKNNDVGTKSVWIGPKILIDRVDAESLKEGENATFINWGNLLVKKINRENNVITSIDAEPNLENKDYKKTLKLTWLAVTEKAKFAPTWCVYFDHIISKPLLGKDEDFKQFIGHETRKEIQMIGDPELRNLKKGDIIQLQRRGFFKVDVAYETMSLFTCKEQPIILFYIPDGHTKESPLAVNVKAGVTTGKNERSSKSGSADRESVKSASEINSEIIKQGDVVRNLKSQKAPKGEVDAAVKVLLGLKADYKTLTKTEWKPGCVPPSETASESTDLSRFDDLNAKLSGQADKVRKLKSEKADKSAVDAEVKILLALKQEYKQKFGKDWVAGAAPPAASVKIESDSDLSAKIATQGDKVRKLKSEKASKSVVDAEVKILLALKQEYKLKFGQDWVPGGAPASAVSVKTESDDDGDLNAKITGQGDKVRKLKSEKAAKSVVDPEVKILLALKQEYKQKFGKDWVAGSAPPKTVQNTSSNKTESELLELIGKQGDIVKKLKGEKASKSDIDREVKTLLQLKDDFKKATGKEWKPNMKPETHDVSATPAAGDNAGVSVSKNALVERVTEQGNIVRELKAKKASKDEIDKALKILLSLKAEYKALTGTDFPVAGRTPAKPKEAPQKAANQKVAPKEKKPVVAEDGGLKKQTRLGLEAKKEENLSDWYSQVITKGEMIEYYDVSGCYIYRPWSFAIWKVIKEWFSAEIDKLGVEDCYFPIFVSRSVLEKEKTHIADFAPEVAWVTKSGDSDMAEPIAVRPTSETVMYPAYAKWIQSYRDLPLKLNQWNNVVRWEFKHPQPFLRTREFLWQEGHTAYATKEEADQEVKTILDLYARIYTDILAIPVVKGRKTEKEKFAGGDYTLTVEAFVSASGRAIQGGTSHHLGQNFSKMFEIIYEDPETQEKKYVYQNSWGITTRTIGVMIMIHADNKGLVLPPRAACVQVVIVPCGITVGLSEEARNNLQASCDALENALKGAGIKVKGDYRNNYSPGWKFNHWELKGVPVRVELGPKDIEKQQIVAVRRDTGEKVTLPRDAAAQKLSNLLDEIQNNLLQIATNDLKSHTVLLKDWSQFATNLDKKNMILVPFCGDSSCEDKIKAESARDDGEAAEPGAPSMGAKSLCIPLDQPAPIGSGDKCIHPDCKRKPLFYTLFGRSY
ncbi:bifunctional glutamate/proline--tRNA ligase [Tenebrio molitor]|uniref:bifunctional glutamate/proline--tRNA ligase n=1 Tax=Tenebrio molitor TaxID=7067 RepID=UPI0036249CBE